MFNSTTVRERTTTSLCAKAAVSAPDADQLGQRIGRIAWLAAIAAALLIPLLVLGFGYVMQHLLAENEAAILSEVVKLQKQSHSLSLSGGGRDALEQLLRAVTIGSGSKVIPNAADSNSALGFVRKHVELRKADGSRTTLAVLRPLQPIFIAAALGLLPGALLGFLVFRAAQAYPRRMLDIAMSELERRTEAEQRLRTANSLFSAILESTAEGIVAIDGHGRVVACNTRYLELWKLTERECESMQGDCMLFTSLAAKIRDPKVFLERNQQLLAAPTIELTEYLELQDGRSFEWISRPQRVLGEVVGRISIFRDVSESRRAEVLLSTEKTVLEKVVRGAPLEDALFVVANAIERESGDMFCAILFCEDGRTTNLNVVTGRSLPSWYQEQLLALHPRIGRYKDDPDCIDSEIPNRWFGSRPYQQLMERLAVSQTILEPIRGSTGDTIGLVLAHYRASSDRGFERDGQLVHIASQMCSIAIDRYRSSRELDLLAHYDFLTGLPNRKHFYDHLRRAIERMQASNRPLGLLFLDLDRFKAVNDSLGHAAGDALLKVAASRIRECVRAHDVVARLSGDEFVVLIEDLPRTEIAAGLARKIAERMTEGVNLNGHETFISASVGIALYPKDGETLEELLKNADAAMYEVKGQGRNGVQFFHARMNGGGLERLQLEGQLRHVLERNEMTIYYQPKVQASTSVIVGAEALLRWRHPEQGLMPPSKFVPLLEETGLIIDFWGWIIRQVCEDILRLDQASSRRINIAVNVSARQLGKPSLREGLLRAVRTTGVDAGRLELELTESLLMKGPQQASQILHELRELGIGGIAIDDFGTGYSSLAYLKRFPITGLKIDRSFVSGIAQSSQDEAIVQAILALAKSLDLRVTAEGVETLEQATSLTTQGCHELQGYYFGRPVPLEDFIKVLNDVNGQACLPRR